MFDKSKKKAAPPAEEAKPSVADGLRAEIVTLAKESAENARTFREAIGRLMVRVGALEERHENLASGVNAWIHEGQTDLWKAEERLGALETWKADLAQTRVEAPADFAQAVGQSRTPALGSVVRYCDASGTEKPAKITGLAAVVRDGVSVEEARLKVFSDDGPETHTNVPFSAEPKPGHWSL